MEIVGIRGYLIALCVFRLHYVERPQKCGDIDKEGAVRDAGPNAFTSAIPEGSVTLPD